MTPVEQALAALREDRELLRRLRAWDMFTGLHPVADAGYWCGCINERIDAISAAIAALEAEREPSERPHNWLCKDECPGCIDPLTAERDALAAKCERLAAAVWWALGVAGEFRARSVNDPGMYYWRAELCERAGISPAELNARAALTESEQR